MNITSRSKEGKAWEKLYKQLTQKLYDMKEISENTKRNFGLEECDNCENLKMIDGECLECDL